MVRVGVGRSVDEERPEGLVDVYWEWLREEISEVVGALAPCDGELTLTDAVADPMKTHVDGFGAVEFDAIIGHADGAGVVAEDVRGGLWVAESDGDCSEPGANASEHIQAGVLTLSNRSDNDVKNAAVDVDGAVDVGRFVGVAKVGDAAGDASGAGTRQVGSVRLHV